MAGASDWWLPLSAYRKNARARCERDREAGVRITFRGARRIYRMARDGIMFLDAAQQAAMQSALRRSVEIVAPGRVKH